ncbi:MAG: hypothetical protein ACMUIP_08110 [bacterium]
MSCLNSDRMCVSSIPHIYEPGNEAEIIDTQPTLTVTNAIDAD